MSEKTNHIRDGRHHNNNYTIFERINFMLVRLIIYHFTAFLASFFVISLSFFKYIFSFDEFMSIGNIITHTSSTLIILVVTSFIVLTLLELAMIITSCFSQSNQYIHKSEGEFNFKKVAKPINEESIDYRFKINRYIRKHFEFIYVIINFTVFTIVYFTTSFTNSAGYLMADIILIILVIANLFLIFTYVITYE